MTSVLRQAGSQALGGLPSTKKQLSVDDIQSKICGEVWKKQIRMKTFFQDYDKLRKGYCIDDKFISGLNTALHFLSVSLTEDQITSLINKYRIYPPGDLIRYSDFVNTIDAQFFNTDLAKTNLQVLKGSHNPTEEDRELLEKLLAYIRWMVKSKRILVKAPLQDYDRTKCSFITKQQFKRVLDNLGLVQNEKLAELLSQKYIRSTNPKQVSYPDFIRDVEDINTNEQTVVKGVVFNNTFQQSRIIQDPQSVSLTQQFYVDKRLSNRLQPIEGIIKRIQAVTTLRRIRIRQFFLDFDGLRKNIVTGQQFKRIMNSLGINLTQDEFKQLLKLYRVDQQGHREQRIKWMDFCDDVDLVFTKKELEKDPLHRVPQIDKSVFEPVNRLTVQFSPEQQQIINNLLKNYQLATNHKRVLLKPLFEDFDITKIGYVTKNQFTRILKQFDFIPPNENEFNLLLKKYMDRGNLNQVNYYQFTRDIDKYTEDAQRNAKSYAQTFKDFKATDRLRKATIRNQNPNDLDDLLARIRKKVKQQRIRLDQFMRDYDKLRHGNITKQQFRKSMNTAGIPVSEAEFHLIISYFQCENKLNYIRWKDFCDVINQVFTKKQLEKSVPNLGLQLSGTNFVYGRQSISPEQLQLANRVKDAFRQHLLANRLDAKQFFENWDKLNRWKVSAKQFRQVLATIGFQMTEEQTKAICKLYETDDQKQVRYLDFVKDTKPYDFSYMTDVKQTFKYGTGSRPTIPQSVEQILFEIRRTTKINRLRYKQYFQDFDPLRKGTITKNKFKGVIFQTLKLPLEQKVFEKLQAYYSDTQDSNLVNYVNFLADIDIVFNLPDYEKDPTVRPQNFDYSIVHSKKQQENIDSLMRRLGEVTKKHRLLLKPFFQDKDIPKIGRVSFLRMRSIMDNNKIPLTDFQYQLLCQNFAFEGKEFNYVDFIEALKKYEESS